jgi:hypothetical protein
MDVNDKEKPQTTHVEAIEMYFGAYQVQAGTSQKKVQAGSA